MYWTCKIYSEFSKLSMKKRLQNISFFFHIDYTLKYVVYIGLYKNYLNEFHLFLFTFYSMWFWGILKFCCSHLWLELCFYCTALVEIFKYNKKRGREWGEKTLRELEDISPKRFYSGIIISMHIPMTKKKKKKSRRLKNCAYSTKPGS